MMYEFATGHWLFKPKATNGIPRDVAHLAQMTQRTGQIHGDAALKQYELRGKQYVVRGKQYVVRGKQYGVRGRQYGVQGKQSGEGKQYGTRGVRTKHHDLKGMLKRATAGGVQLAPIESELNESTVYNNGAEEVRVFVRIMRSFLAFDPAQRPRASKALLDPVFKDIL